MKHISGNFYKEEKIIVQYICGEILNIVTKRGEKYKWYQISKESNKKKGESVDLGYILEKIPDYWD